MQRRIKWNRSYNPATGEVIAEVPISTKEDLDQAVKVAAETFETWKEVACSKTSKNFV